MIQTIAFDIGNVLVNYYPDQYIRQFVRDDAETARVNELIFSSAPWKAGDAGEMTRQQTIDALCDQYPADADIIRTVMANCDEMLTAVEENTVLLRDLKQAGFDLYFLSNTNPSAFEYMSSTHEFFRYLTDGIASFRVKLLKPSHDIFRCFLTTFDKAPETCIFVDDTPVNVQAAGEVGFHTVLLKKPQDLREELRAFPEIRARLDALKG